MIDRAVPGGSPGHLEALELGPATGTTSALDAVGEQERVGQGLAPRLDRRLEHAAHLPMEAEDLPIVQRVRTDLQMDARLERDLVDVNVADPSDETLIRQGALDRPPLALERRAEGVRSRV